MLADELQLGHPEAVAARQQLLAELAEERAQSGVAGAYLFGAPRLARFLQGNNCSVDEAAAHFRRMLQWRTLEGMEQRRLVVDGKPWSPDSVPGLRELFGFMFVRNEWVNASSWAPDGHLIWIQRDGRAQLDKIMEVRDGMLMGRMAKILKLVNVAYPESMHKLILFMTEPFEECSIWFWPALDSSPAIAQRADAAEVCHLAKKVEGYSVGVGSVLQPLRHAKFRLPVWPTSGAMSGASAVFIMDMKGKVIISRNYRGEVPMNVTERFQQNVIDADEAEVKPVFNEATLILAFLYRTAEVLRDYFNELEEESIKDNFVITYELLDELMDNGYPQTTEVKILREYIKTSSNAMSIEQMRPPTAVTNAVSWRSEGIKHKKNEVFLDVVERLNLLVSSNGSVLRSEILGALKMKSYLSGMPELKLGLNDKLLFEAAGRSVSKGKSVEMEDIKFHQCVRLARFENDRTISFIPPDGEFELMSYRLNTHVKPLLWVEAVVDPGRSRSRIEYMIKAKSQFKSRSVANNVEIHIPVPSDVDSPSFKTTIGTVKYVPDQECIVWSIKQFQGQKDFIMTANFGLPSIGSGENQDGYMKKPMSVKFEIPYFTVSGVTVRYLKIIEKSGYQALPWVRYITQNGDYQLRMVLVSLQAATPKFALSHRAFGMPTARRFIFVAGGPHDFPREMRSCINEGSSSRWLREDPSMQFATPAPKRPACVTGRSSGQHFLVGPRAPAVARRPESCRWMVAWNFEVFPKGATLRFSAFFVSMGKAAPLASLVKEVLPQAMVHDRVTGSHRPEAGSSGLLWLTWSNESWSQDGQVRHLRMQTTGSRAEAAELGAFQALQKLPQDNHRVQLRGCGCFPWWGCQEDDNLEPARSFASLKPTLPNQQRGRQELFTTQSPDDAVENSSPTLVASQKDIEPMLIVTFLAAMYALIVISLSISRFIA
ncbi:unnamed protein product [Polarella glacialis]|uniref:MHD domain-containing protein n=1 Tax=Polarella glacialis TaxID=89957 RepID=A0A813FGT3_POLGL|nr:unnamed protein product [Polarella glacialis]